MKPSVSVIILTLNEETNIERCLKSVADWAAEIIVVDSGSTDLTLEIAERFGARVAKHAFKNQADQFNWALDNLEIKSDWILRLDADEYILPELAEEIKSVIGSTSAVNGYYIKRRVYFMGRWIKHGGYYPTWILRLFRKGEGRSEDRIMDEYIILLEGRAGRLKNDFADDNRKSLSDWTMKHNDYSSREVAARFGEPDAPIGGSAGRKRWVKNNFYLRLPLFFRSFAYFIYRYFFCLGFLDGKEGLIYHTLQGFWHQFLTDAKTYERIKNANDGRS